MCRLFDDPGAGHQWGHRIRRARYPHYEPAADRGRCRRRP